MKTELVVALLLIVLSCLLVGLIFGIKTHEEVIKKSLKTRCKDCKHFRDCQGYRFKNCDNKNNCKNYLKNGFTDKDKKQIEKSLKDLEKSVLINTNCIDTLEALIEDNDNAIEILNDKVFNNGKNKRR